MGVFPALSPQGRPTRPPRGLFEYPDIVPEKSDRI
jgi:hypothetical protein